MNENIKQLAKKANFFYNLEVQSNGVTWIVPIEEPGTNGNLERFANLIVKEYAMLAKIKALSIVQEARQNATDKAELDAATAMAWEFRVFADEIKEHFGVEE